MKNVITFFIYTFVSTIFISCSDSSSPDIQNKFALFLLENDSLQTIDVQELQLSQINLKNNPVFTFQDVVGYQIDNHKVYLNQKLSYYFCNNDSLKIFANYFGLPFVLIANDERIYLGSFVTGLSSWGPNTPKILDYSVNNSENSFIISGAPIYDETTFIDVRNDERIFRALGDKLIGN